MKLKVLITRDCVGICTEDGYGIANVDTEANAEFIVRCVNSHDDLLGALKEAQPALLSAILFIEGVFPDPRGDILKQELTSYRLRELKLRNAIDKAKRDR